MHVVPQCMGMLVLLVHDKGPAQSVYLLRVSLRPAHSPYPYRAIIPLRVEPPQTTLVIARYTHQRSVELRILDRPLVDSSHSVTSSYLELPRSTSRYLLLTSVSEPRRSVTHDPQKYISSIVCPLLVPLVLYFVKWQKPLLVP